MEHPADTTMDATPPNSGVDISNNQEPSPRMESVVESNMNITMPDSADGVENAQKVYLNVQDPNMDVAMSNSGVDIGNAQEDVKQEIDTQRAESPLFVPDMSRKRKGQFMPGLLR